MTDSIKYEIQQLQNKILELEQKAREKEIEEENAKTPTFRYYFDKLFEFIKMKNDAVNKDIITQKIYGHNDRNKHLPEIQECINVKLNSVIKKHNAEYVPALEHIYSALYAINERLTKLENGEDN
jgi:hypothetical protein